MSRQLVLITGAGASSGLGKDGHGVPQMTEWVDLLIADLEAVIPGGAKLLGLTTGLPGIKFEENLGQYLGYVDALKRIAPEYVKLGAAALAAQRLDTGALMSGYNVWRQHADERNTLIMEVVRANLFVNFGPGRIDSGKARAAYAALISWFPRVDDDREVLAIATTNYDLTAEIGLIAGAQRINDGFSPSVYETPVLQPLGMAERAKSNGEIPIIHLHGAVGWYREDGEIRKPRRDDQPYLAGSDPAVALPDSTKTRASLPGTTHLRDEFDKLILDATHIAFLGHSLNDGYLAQQVKGLDCSKAVFSYVAGDFTDSVVPAVPAAEEDRIREILGSDTLVIPCNFGAEAMTDRAALQVWWEGLR